MTSKRSVIATVLAASFVTTMGFAYAQSSSSTGQPSSGYNAGTSPPSAYPSNNPTHPSNAAPSGSTTTSTAGSPATVNAPSGTMSTPAPGSSYTTSNTTTTSRDSMRTERMARTDRN